VLRGLVCVCVCVDGSGPEWYLMAGFGIISIKSATSVLVLFLSFLLVIFLSLELLMI
jgi:hypothetical protein